MAPWSHRDLRDRIDELVDEEQRLLRESSGQGVDQARHTRLQELRAELDDCWDTLRRRGAGQVDRLADVDVPDPPNDLDGPEPEPIHLDHGFHEDQPPPDPGINPNVP